MGGRKSNNGRIKNNKKKYIYIIEHQLFWESKTLYIIYGGAPAVDGNYGSVEAINNNNNNYTKKNIFIYPIRKQYRNKKKGTVVSLGSNRCVHHRKVTSSSIYLSSIALCYCIYTVERESHPLSIADDLLHGVGAREKKYIYIYLKETLLLLLVVVVGKTKTDRKKRERGCPATSSSSSV